MDSEEEEDIGIDDTIVFAVEILIDREIVGDIRDSEFILVTVREFQDGRSGNLGLEIVVCVSEVREVSGIERTSRETIGSVGCRWNPICYWDCESSGSRSFCADCSSTCAPSIYGSGDDNWWRIG